MHNRSLIPRRTFLGGLGAAAGAAMGPARAAVSSKVIDVHDHLHHHSVSTWREGDRLMIDAADKLGIDQLCCSILPPERPATPESFRQCNQWLLEAMHRFPGRVLGYAFVNPGYTKEALDEIRRRVERDGFIGIKLYNDYFASDPIFRPVVELCIELRIPILHHAGHPSWLPSPQPHISDGSHFSKLAAQYPEAMIICAHIAGGGDWEWEIKALRNAPTVYLDTSGSVIDEGVVEMATRILGADRLLFACDMSLTASVGRMHAADISEADKAKIMSG
ncbi:MAG TPA: amidohydrolase family protein, partial [Bryobacteraceae bacterium]|nr:amidohydrolase family protein [Bryobacteraceae bacterium]